MSVEISVGRGMVAIVDAEDCNLVMSHRWRAMRNRTVFYAKTEMEINGRRSLVSMHRLLMSAKPGQIVDHVNGNTLDNRRSNLRFVTSSENTRNRVVVKARSGYKGVYRVDALSERWQAMLTKLDRRINIGNFGSDWEAAIAYDRAATREFGDYAQTNFPRALLARLEKLEIFVSQCAESRLCECAAIQACAPQAFDAFKMCCTKCAAKAVLADLDAGGDGK